MARCFRPALLAACAWLLVACSDSGTDAGARSCAAVFNPELAQTGADCRPRYGAFCELNPAPFFNVDRPSACAGVQLHEGRAAAGGETIDYLVMEPVGAGPATPTMLALHYSLSNGATLAERMRLAELVKGRGLRIVLPDAPGTSTTWGRPLGASLLLPDPRVAQIDAVLAAAAPGQTVMVMGVSGGGVLAFEYACQRSARVSGVLLIVAEIRDAELGSCRPASGFASVQLHGTADLVAPYERILLLSAGVETVYAALRANNGCSQAREQGVALPSPEAPVIPELELRWVREGCRSGQGSALLKIQNGGHNIPGASTSLGLPVNFFGPIATGFDSTLQGYDLLRYLGG
jgi:polyhydroxybutyrate depolymerase